MHEIRAIVPPELTEEAARLAHEAGIERVSIAEVFIHGPALVRQMVSAETSTPKARAFLDALLNSPAFSGIDYTVTSREVRSIVSNESLDGGTGRAHRSRIEPEGGTHGQAGNAQLHTGAKAALNVDVDCVFRAVTLMKTLSARSYSRWDAVLAAERWSTGPIDPALTTVFYTPSVVNTPTFGGCRNR